MAVVISGNGIDMGNNPVSNVSIVASAYVVDKAYVDSLKTIATGTATFNSTTNNINLTGIGIGVEIGDVIQITGADDAKNNSEFTVEVITDNNNVIVNQAHANQGTTKNVANRSGDTGVTVKLLAKWYNADVGLGQDWVNVGHIRTVSVIYPNNTNRTIIASCSVIGELLHYPAARINIYTKENTLLCGSVNTAETGTGLTTASNVTIPITRDNNYALSSNFGVGNISMTELR